MKPVLLNKVSDYPKSGLGRITTATNQIVHEVINGDYTFTFNMLVTDKLFPKIDDEMIIATSVSVNDTDFFYIKNIDIKNPGTVTITCNHITMLSNENYVRGKMSIDGKSVKSIISEMTSKLDLPGQKFTYDTDINQVIGKTDIIYTNSNPGQILIGDTNSLAKVLDARLVRKGLNMTLTTKNTNRYIDLRYGKNISGVTINRNTNNLVTSIVPYFNMKSKEVVNDTDETPTNAGGWTIKSASGQVTVKSTFGVIYTDINVRVNNRALAKGTAWKTDMQREKNLDYQYRVATNMWLSANDVDFDGSIGEVISKPATSVEPSDTVPEDQLQYGPEIYSPLFDSKKMRHRKYVNYSSRVDNIPDLIDVSSKYFIENPDIDKPTYTITIDVARANQKRVVNAQIGDIARIYDPKYGLESNETIIEREFDPDLNTNKTLKAGVFQQTIFRYLDKRIKASSQKVDNVKKQTNSGLDSLLDNINGVQTNLTNSTNDLNQKLDASAQAAKDKIDEVKGTVSKAQTTMTNFMNSGGNNKIRWIPTLAEATQMEITTPYGYWLLDDRGAGFHSNNGTVRTGLSADGRIYADSITGNSLTGTSITGGYISGGTITGAQIYSSSLRTSSHIQVLNSSGAVSTSVASYGISTPALTVTNINGASSIQTSQLQVYNDATIRYLHVSGNISGNSSGLYLQGPVYVDGRQI